MMEHLGVRKWENFQQYRDRDPKWIKFHRSTLDDYEIEMLPENTQLHLFKIWLLAAKHDNRIPNDQKWIAKKIGAQSEVDIDQLVTKGFLFVYENVQDCTDVYKSVPREEERRGEREKKNHPPAEPSADPWKDVFDLVTEVCGQGSNGLAGKLKQVVPDPIECFVVIEQCRGKDNPKSYLAGAIKGIAKEARERDAAREKDSDSIRKQIEAYS